MSSSKDRLRIIYIIGEIILIGLGVYFIFNSDYFWGVIIIAMNSIGIVFEFVKKFSVLRVILGLIGIILIIVALVAVGVNCYYSFSLINCEKNSKGGYYGVSEKTFIIPEINKGFVPQGFDYYEDGDLYFITGYVPENSSPLFLVNQSNGELVKKVFLKDDKGEVYDGHGGGVALFDKYFYIAGSSDYCFYVYSMQDVLNAKTGDTLNCLGTFSTKYDDGDYVIVSSVTTDGKYIYAVEFFSEPKYKTLISHKFTTNAGDYNQAIAVAYELDATCEFGIKQGPVCVYSLPDKVQGMEVVGQKVYLSCSLGLKNSNIKTYDLTKANQEKTVNLLGKELPLYAFDSNSLIKSVKVPPMSEEIVVLNDKLLIMSEFACNKYILGKFTGAKWCYATEIAYFG